MSNKTKAKIKVSKNTYLINGNEYEVKPLGIKQVIMLKAFAIKNQNLEINIDADGEDTKHTTVLDILEQFVNIDAIGEVLSILIAKVGEKWHKDNMIHTQSDIAKENLDIETILDMGSDFLAQSKNLKNLVIKLFPSLSYLLTKPQDLKEV